MTIPWLIELIGFGVFAYLLVAVFGQPALVVVFVFGFIVLAGSIGGWLFYKHLLRRTLQ